MGDRVWVTSQEAVQKPPADPGPTAATVRLSSSAPFQTDPALVDVDPQINYATCAKLVNYPDAAAPDGTRLVPEVAAALPSRSPDGRTYTFTIREGFKFSPPHGERVTAQTFKHAIERSLHPKTGSGAAAFAPDIVGLDAYRTGKAADISGVVVDGSASRSRSSGRTRPSSRELRSRASVPSRWTRRSTRRASGRWRPRGRTTSPRTSPIA